MLVLVPVLVLLVLVLLVLVLLVPVLLVLLVLVASVEESSRLAGTRRRLVSNLHGLQPGGR